LYGNKKWIAKNIVLAVNLFSNKLTAIYSIAAPSIQLWPQQFIDILLYGFNFMIFDEEPEKFTRKKLNIGIT